jgi:hypothetical protein
LLQQLSQQVPAVGHVSRSELRAAGCFPKDSLGPVRYRNAQVAKLFASTDFEGAGVQLEQWLRHHGAFALGVVKKRWVDQDGSRYAGTFVRAASTEMWPMGTHCWVRDCALVGARLLEESGAADRRQGRQLLQSVLELLSSCAQLQRFRKIIEARSQKFIRNPHNWPHVFLAFDGNLAGSAVEPWSHQQDAWQMAAWHVLRALEHGVMQLEDLSGKQREFLGVIVPFLAKVSFWRSESSGSWEEIPAVRSSVVVWEHLLVLKLGELAQRKGFSFLVREYDRLRSTVGGVCTQRTFQQVVEFLDRRAIDRMRRALPAEAPEYARADPRYRRADAALVYLLQLNYPQLLAQRAGLAADWAWRMERRIVKLLMTLHDPLTGGMARYGNDSYQRSGYFRNETVRRLTELYGGPSGDASEGWVQRNQLLGAGRLAMWTHCVWQLAAWAGRNALTAVGAAASEYRRLHEHFFRCGAALITGDGEVSIEVHPTGRTTLLPIPAWRMPECYISEGVAAGGTLVFPSPHTPLNWAVAEMRSAFVAHRALRTQDSSTKGRARPARRLDDEA